MNIIAVIPVYSREDILKITIPRLLLQVSRVIMVGHYESEFISGTEFYICDRKVKRGAKWQFAIDKAREFNPDAILISSSGGVYRDNYFNIDLRDVHGSSTLNYLDIQPTGMRAIYWPGYNASRSNEPVGLGRIISSRFLDRCNWQIYPKDSQNGLDFRSMAVFRKFNADISICSDNPPMRISSYKYVQTNSFDRMAKINNSTEANVDDLLTYYDLKI